MQHDPPSVGFSASRGSAQQHPADHSQQKRWVRPGIWQWGMEQPEKRNKIRCHTATTVSGSCALLQTFPGGALKRGQELGEGLKKWPEMYQINKHFLLVCYAPSTVLAVRDTKMKMTSVTSNPCLVHPPVQWCFRSRAEFRGSTGSGSATTQGTHGGSIRERRGDTAPQRAISVTGCPPGQENELSVLHLHLHLFN